MGKDKGEDKREFELVAILDGMSDAVEAAKVDIVVYGQCVIAISPNAVPRHIPLHEFYKDKE